MPRILWPLQNGRPCLRLVLTLKGAGQPLERALLADTGAGFLRSRFELILSENDCLLCGGTPAPPVVLRGAYAGGFPSYHLSVHLPALGFHRNLRAVAVSLLPRGFDGIAGFRFLNRFTYGNFGDPNRFGLES